MKDYHFPLLKMMWLPFPMISAPWRSLLNGLSDNDRKSAELKERKNLQEKKKRIPQTRVITVKFSI